MLHSRTSSLPQVYILPLLPGKHLSQPKPEEVRRATWAPPIFPHLGSRPCSGRGPSPEGRDEDVDDDSDKDQGGGRIVELVESPLPFYLVEVQSSCGEEGEANEGLGGGGMTAWSFPNHSPSEIRSWWPVC